MSKNVDEERENIARVDELSRATGPANGRDTGNGSHLDGDAPSAGALTSNGERSTRGVSANGGNGGAPGAGLAPVGGTTMKHWIAPVLVSLIGAFMSILDTSVVNVAIPTMMNVFGASAQNVEWVATIYMLALGVVVPVSGWLGDKIGFKLLYMIALGGFTFGSFLCTMSWSLTSLIVARVIQALGGGMIMPTAMAMIYRIVPRDKIGGAMGVFGLSILVAPAIGPTLGGYLVEYVDWRWIFTINLPIGVIGILLSIAILPDFKAHKVGKFDYLGAITSALGLFCLLLALSKGSEWGWGSEKTILMLYLSVVSLGLFVYVELTQPDPLIDLRVFKYRTFTLGNLTMMITTIGLFAGLFYLPLFLQNIRGLGAMQTGLLMMPGALMSGITMPIAGRLYDKIGPKVLVFAGLAGLAAITYVFHYINLETTYATFTLWVILRGLPMAFANMPAQTAALAVIPQEMVGRASAVTNIIRNVSSSFGIATLTAVLTNRMALHTQHMADTVTSTSIATQEYLRNFAAQAGGSVAATRSGALAQINAQIQQLSFVKGIDDLFIIASVLTVLGVIPAIFLKKVSAHGRSGPVAE